MSSATAHVVLLAFRDAVRSAAVVAAARRQTGVRAMALVGRAADCELRIVGGVGEDLADARPLAWAFAVLDTLSGPLRTLAGSPPKTEAVTLPDSDEGYAVFGRLVHPGALVILAAVCDDTNPPIASFTATLRAAVATEQRAALVPAESVPGSH
jgi:hypothetical protein